MRLEIKLVERWWEMKNGSEKVRIDGGQKNFVKSCGMEK